MQKPRNKRKRRATTSTSARNLRTLTKRLKKTMIKWFLQLLSNKKRKPLNTQPKLMMRKKKTKTLISKPLTKEIEEEILSEELSPYETIISHQKTVRGIESLLRIVNTNNILSK
jgi:hypothetical protein